MYFPRALAEEAEDVPSLASLVGFEIVDASNRKAIGTIADIDDSTVNILFEMENGMLIPANDDLIEDIDAEQRTITMNIPKGLLSLR